MVYVQMINIGQIETRFSTVFVWLASFIENVQHCPAPVQLSKLYIDFPSHCPFSTLSNQFTECILFEWFESIFPLEHHFVWCFLQISFMHTFTFCPPCLWKRMGPNERNKKTECSVGCSWNVITIACSIVLIVSRSMNNGWRKTIELWLCHCFIDKFYSIHWITLAPFEVSPISIELQLESLA